MGRRVKAISAGQCHSLALSEDQVFAWGAGGFGQIGHGIVEDALWPVPVGGFLVGRRVQVVLYVVCGMCVVRMNDIHVRKYIRQEEASKRCARTPALCLSAASKACQQLVKHVSS